jgi:hypothetical protein
MIGKARLGCDAGEGVGRSQSVIVVRDDLGVLEIFANQFESKAETAHKICGLAQKWQIGDWMGPPTLRYQGLHGATHSPVPRKCGWPLSSHCYLDPSSGAALCTRELLELLAARGMDCRVLTIGILDPERETSLDEVLATLELPVRRFQAELRTGGSAEVIDLGVNGVRVTVMPTVSSRAERSPDPRE